MTISPLSKGTFASHRRRLLELMKQLSFEKRSVTLSSGKSSDFYIDSKQTVLSAEGHYLAGLLLFYLVLRDAPKAEAAGGLTMGADPLASALSLVSFVLGKPLPAFYVRKEPKGHGTLAWLEGTKNLRSKMPVVILEDVVTTGASTLRAIERARLFGLDVIRVLALVDREEEGGRAQVEKEAPLTALFSRQDFFAEVAG